MSMRLLPLLSLLLAAACAAPGPAPGRSLPTLPDDVEDPAAAEVWLGRVLFDARFEERDLWLQYQVARAYAGESVWSVQPAPDAARADGILAEALEELGFRDEAERREPGLRELAARMLLLRGRLHLEGGPGLEPDREQGLRLTRSAMAYDAELTRAALAELEGERELVPTVSLDAIRATPGRRVALVVGNAAYEHTEALVGPDRDARLLADTLEQLGFEVLLHVDAPWQELGLALEEFGGRTADAAVALFFYSGHAMQVDGENWLVPVDTDLRSERDLVNRCFPLDRVLVQFDRDVRHRLVVLDASRPNPMAAAMAGTASTRDWGKRGLTVVGQGARDTLIAFSTAPGATTGERGEGAYVDALVRRLREPGVEIGRVFRLVRDDVREATNGTQVPWESSSLGADGLYLTGAN